MHGNLTYSHLSEKLLFHVIIISVKTIATPQSKKYKNLDKCPLRYLQLAPFKHSISIPRSFDPLLTPSRAVNFTLLSLIE